MTRGARCPCPLQQVEGTQLHEGHHGQRSADAESPARAGRGEDEGQGPRAERQHHPGQSGLHAGAEEGELRDGRAQEQGGEEGGHHGGHVHQGAASPPGAAGEHVQPEGGEHRDAEGRSDEVLHRVAEEVEGRQLEDERGRGEVRAEREQGEHERPQAEGQSPPRAPQAHERQDADEGAQEEDEDEELILPRPVARARVLGEGPRHREELGPGEGPLELIRPSGAPGGVPGELERGQGHQRSEREAPGEPRPRGHHRAHLTPRGERHGEGERGLPQPRLRGAREEGEARDERHLRGAARRRLERGPARGQQEEARPRGGADHVLLRGQIREGRREREGGGAQQGRGAGGAQVAQQQEGARGGEHHMEQVLQGEAELRAREQHGEQPGWIEDLRVQRGGEGLPQPEVGIPQGQLPGAQRLQEEGRVRDEDAEGIAPRQHPPLEDGAVHEAHAGEESQPGEEPPGDCPAHRTRRRHRAGSLADARQKLAWTSNRASMTFCREMGAPFLSRLVWSGCSVRRYEPTASSKMTGVPSWMGRSAMIFAPKPLNE